MWLYVPNCKGSVSVPGSEESASDCTLPVEGSETSVTLRGRCPQRRSLLSAWKKASYLRVLSGLTCEPSIADAGVDSWILSTAEFHASPGVWLAKEEESATSDTSGPTSSASSRKRKRRTSLSKTSPDSESESPLAILIDGMWMTPQKNLFQGWEEYSQTLPKQGGMRSGSLYQRKTSVPLNAASESSCWGGDAGLWPTPDANVFQDGHKLNSEEWDARRQRLKMSAGNGNGCGTPLAMAAQLWQTPAGIANTDSTGKRAGPSGNELGNQAILWQTPQLPNGGGRTRGGERGNELLLEGQAELWATPLAAEAMCQESLRPTESILAHSESRDRSETSNIEDQVALWATPAARDWKSGDASQETLGSNSRPLNEQVTVWLSPARSADCPSGLQAQGWVVTALSMTSSNFSIEALKRLGVDIRPNSETPSFGCESSKSDPTSRLRSPKKRLNPIFVSWLMNFPDDWLYPGSINFAGWETLVRRCKSALLSAYFGTESIG